MKSKVLYVALGLVGIVLLSGLLWLAVRGQGTKPPVDGKINVVASFYPMAEFARQVGGDHVRVSTLVKQGTEPHDYDPTPTDIAGIYTSHLLVYNGGGLEPWADRLQNDLKKNNVVSVNASRDIALHKAAENGEHMATDPHVWLDPELAVKQVAAIEAGLIKADPQHRKDYEHHAAAYTARLQALDISFQKGLKQCQQHEIVTSHQAFGYLATHYDFTAEGIAGLSPDDEPSPQKLAEVATFVREHNVKYIFFETLVSPKLADTIAQETGAKTLTFNPLEGLTADEVKQDKTYLSLQNDNLQALRTAMDCE